MYVLLWVQVFSGYCRMRVKKLPHVLALHLKRFKLEQPNRSIKLSYRVVFPLELRLFNTVVTIYYFFILCGLEHDHICTSQIDGFPSSWDWLQTFSVVTTKRFIWELDDHDTLWRFTYLWFKSILTKCVGEYGCVIYRSKLSRYVGEYSCEGESCELS